MKQKLQTKMRKFGNFQRQERIIEPLSDKDYKYLKELLGNRTNENIYAVTRGGLRSQHI